MLLTLLAWAAVTTICFVAGGLTLRLLARDPEEAAAPPFAVVCMTGIAVLSALLGILSLFLKLGAAADAFLAGPLLVAAALDRRRLLRLARESMGPIAAAGVASHVLLAALLLLILWCASDEPLHFDTGLYHAQAVRWIEEAPAVRGLGNLHGRLAFNSSWWLPSAAFGFSFLGAGPLHGLNGLVLAWMALFCWPGVVEIARGRIDPGAVMRLLILLLLVRHFLRTSSSVATDLPVAAMGSILFVTIADAAGAGGRLSASHAAILLPLALAAPTVKLSTLPLLLLVPLFLVPALAGSAARKALLIGALAALLWGPWMTRGMLLSGYPAYPLRLGGVLDVDWKIPGEDVDRMARLIRTYACDPGATGADPASLAWIPGWFARLLPADQATLILLLLALALHALSVAWPLLKPTPSPWPALARVALAAWVAALFWFFSAPIPRFGYFALCPLLALHAAGPLAALGRRFPRSSRAALLGLAGSLLVAMACFSVLRSERRGRLLVPRGYPDPALVRTDVRGGFVQVPLAGPLTWYATPPAAPQPPDGLEWRGSAASDGFRIRRP
jgi:hypothetical protein